MRRILIIQGSARNGSVTNKISEEIETFYKGEQIAVFNCFKKSFKPCNGCNFCEENGRCVNGDLDGFFRDFENADIIFFMSPVYNGTFSAPFKALLDRFQVYYESFYKNGKKQPIEKHRKAYFIAASGRNGEKSFAYMTSQLECAFTILNIELKESFLCAYTDTDPDITSAVGKIKRSLKND